MAEDLERRLARKGQSGFRGKYLYLAREVKTDVFTGAPRARVQRVLLRSLQLQPACHHPSGRVERQSSSERRAARALSLWPAPGGRRGDMSQTRRLAAILAADVAGYSRLMGADEEGTLERLKAMRRELLDPKIAEHHGRIVKTTGDGLLVEFASVLDAVRCAVEVQQAMPERNAPVAADRRIQLRIGINLGDVIVEGDDLYGDGVNIAARIEALADAGGVFVSNTVHDQVSDRLPVVFEDLGEQQGQEHCPAGAGLPAA
jgi:class 3 adenylate cyclase